ncbi:hypothetical protein LMG6871_02868 [Ralstonia edaphis]|uniref:hypothetical protein n=1 Tax=Ralstonia edaphi TaxID=3058599 RepID=UPI0028F5B2B1|nr:hypothetical protein [Ralstonia sp. LMG 6871]CAJ0719442.1 hypothetical protein LMG6871_02868 [Ralstonia sp. LMG 6871]
MNTKHTLGEWHESTHGGKTWIQTDEQHRSSGNSANDGFCIAQFFGPDAITNARLAALSPRMLEVLDHIGGLSRALRSGGPDPMDLQELSDALEEAVDMANEMVRKAEGE